MMLIQPQTLFPSCSPVTSKIAQASLKLSQTDLNSNIYFLFCNLGQLILISLLVDYNKLSCWLNSSQNKLECEGELDCEPRLYLN